MRRCKRRSQMLSESRWLGFRRCTQCTAVEPDHYEHDRRTCSDTAYYCESKTHKGNSREEPAKPRQYSAASYALTAEASPLDEAAIAYQEFLEVFPEYRLTWIVDALRRSDYGRLEASGETYVDYMGGAIYSEGLVRAHTEFLTRSLLGNTHSISTSSKLSAKCADNARAAVLSFFQAPSDEYTVVFTPNATGALKLVGEAYPFTGASSYVLACDSHNSVHGIRDYATSRGSRVCYIPSTPTGGFDPSTAKTLLSQNQPESKDSAPCLFALTGQSNISNTKSPLTIVGYAASLGYHTLLDAAALAPTSRISLTECRADAMAVSFYKMFGFPTGIGALVIKKAFLAQLKRPWFAGGNVDFVQVPGSIVIRSHELHEQFEDGTINYLALSAITNGLRFLSAFLPFLPLRHSCLLHYLISELSKLRHDTNGAHSIRILSETPSRRLKQVGEQSDTGSVVSLVFLSPSGELMPNSFVEYVASTLRISLRTGCMCNPGAAAALLRIEDDMQRLYACVTAQDIERVLGRELGVVRVSFGIASNFQDAHMILRLARLLSIEKSRAGMWERYIDDQRHLL
ncbi:pyridoxal phosphate-dependent transferase [Mycena belliarum]|uniref:Pyridoxal phosphate-dependent transferase n=1 Tax=Mycena belliarum TaxID=1033014 RepID=A0AAD6UCR9_9AGAR|nr:pyridoxal phosphate-dependent transferase [Mycena belliae]